jgi:DNA mismatch endonuclease, patch repair protein
MRRITAKDSEPEMAIRRLVHRMGFRYQLHNQRLPGRPDLVFPRLRKIIFVHGCFWHGHAGCSTAHVPHSRREYWGPKLIRTSVRDRENENKLCAIGWSVLTVWECELRDPQALQHRVEAFLSGRGTEAATAGVLH